MKLILAIVHDRDRHKLSDRLVKEGFRFTQLASTGGFLREGNTTFMIGVDDEQVDAALHVVDDCSRTREQFVNLLPPDAGAAGALIANPVSVRVGGAVAFVLPVDRFEQL
ncbi:MAG TPA: cyclic-di-AMP receptor [Armatimonadota bacterium]|jgi:uncharacterized protein YaaQ